MLSKTDLQKELGNNINIFPFNERNLKENSINLSASRYSWTLTSGSYDLSSIRQLGLQGPLQHEFEKGKSATVDINGKKYIILLPFSTTLIETVEVLAVSGNIGGTYHSKVGLVSKGVGHIGTMLGPNFSGQSLIALHNVSSELIAIAVNDTIVSVIFHYLKSPITTKNPTVSGHLEKMSELGVLIAATEQEELGLDWKSKFEEVQDKLRQSDEFISFKKKISRQRNKDLLTYLNKRNIIIIISTICLLLGTYFLAFKIDVAYNTQVWRERYWNVGFSGIFITILAFLRTLIKKGK